MESQLSGVRAQLGMSHIETPKPLLQVKMEVEGQPSTPQMVGTKGSMRKLFNLQSRGKGGLSMSARHKPLQPGGRPLGTPEMFEQLIPTMGLS